MFSRLLIEREVIDSQVVQNLRERFSKVPVKVIDDAEEIFNRVKKPYLQKREDLQLFVAKKRGTLVKPAPDAYGQAGDPHYYYIHAYNCIYECTYCYLQGHFHSPDLVFFVNHDEILAEIEKTILETEDSHSPWFHAGEFSDSLALSHLTGELPLYYELFSKYPNAKLELRTKSANIKELLKLKALSNVKVSFSLTPAEDVKEHDLKTPPLAARIRAMKALASESHRLGIHFDPMIYREEMLEKYQELIDQIKSEIGWDSIDYLSLGVVRFTKDVYHQVEKNYPNSSFHSSELIRSFDGKVRYIKAQRAWMMSAVKEKLIKSGLPSEKIYLCMEN